MQEDIETAFEISSITFVFAWPEETSYVTDFTLSLANVENDQLTETFAENYAQGTLVEVYHTDSLHLENGYGNELVLELDIPFFYNGQDNLLIDIYYPDGDCWSRVYNWEAGTARCLTSLFLPGGSPSSTGYLFEWIPYMVFEGTQSLEQNTFGAVKVILGGYGN